MHTIKNTIDIRAHHENASWQVCLLFYRGGARRDAARSILKLLGNIGQDLVHEEEARRASEKEAQATYDQLVAQTVCAYALVSAGSHRSAHNYRHP